MMKELRRLFFIFLRIGAFTFGGGYVMLPIIQHELSEKYHLIDEESLSDLLVLAQSLPGVLAINAATLVGYRLHGKRGAVLCAFGVVLPSFCIIVLLAQLIFLYQDNPRVIGAFTAVRAVVVGMIIAAAVKMAKPCYRDKRQMMLLLSAALIVFCSALHPIILILVGGVVGWILSCPEKQQEVE